MAESKNLGVAVDFVAALSALSQFADKLPAASSEQGNAFAGFLREYKQKMDSLSPEERRKLQAQVAADLGSSASASAAKAPAEVRIKMTLTLVAISPRIIRLSVRECKGGCKEDAACSHKITQWDTDLKSLSDQRKINVLVRLWMRLEAEGPHILDRVVTRFKAGWPPVSSKLSDKDRVWAEQFDGKETVQFEDSILVWKHLILDELHKDKKWHLCGKCIDEFEDGQRGFDRLFFGDPTSISKNRTSYFDR